MRYTLAFACLLVATSADAREPIPIATFSWSQPQPVTLPAEYGASLRMYTPEVSAVGWRETIAAYPFHSFADQAMVDAWNAEHATGFAAPDWNGQIAFVNGGQNYGICGWCQLH
jgi:hypothetical protein